MICFNILISKLVPSYFLWLVHIIYSDIFISVRLYSYQFRYISSAYKTVGSQYRYSFLLIFCYGIKYREPFCYKVGFLTPDTSDDVSPVEEIVKI